MPILNEKRILLALSGGISAYRTLELIRLLRADGACVQPVATSNALEFVTPLSLEALSQTPCLSNEKHLSGGQINHIEHAYNSDLMVVVPATANCLAKMAHGFADELLYQTLLSFRGPVLVAPAMESNMWTHPATQQNMKILKERGVGCVGPNEGPLASGRSGMGRMAEPAEILDAIRSALAPQDFAGVRVCVTAGPTQEPLDPVRYISNRSSGKMGVALAMALGQRGAQVDLVHGPLAVPIPKHAAIRTISVTTAHQMHDAVMSLSDGMDVAILCAAVSDYRPQQASTQKIKKSSDLLSVTLEKNPDILADLGKQAKRLFLVGFAAETENVEANAIEKCRSKNADLICANDVSVPDQGFDADCNSVLIVNQEGVVKRLDKAPKQEIAHGILDVLSTFQGAL